MVNITIAPYDLGNYSNATDLFLITSAANDTLNGLFGVGLLILIFLMVFLGMKKGLHPTTDSLLTASIITTLLCVIMITPLNFLSLNYIWYCIGITILSLFAKFGWE